VKARERHGEKESEVTGRTALCIFFPAKEHPLDKKTPNNHRAFCTEKFLSSVMQCRLQAKQLICLH